MSENPYRAPYATQDAYPTSSSARELPEELFEALRQTRPWVVFLAILGFIGCALMALGGFAILAFGSLMKTGGKEAFPTWLGLIYLPFAALYVPPCVFLLQYGSALRTFVTTGDMDSLAAAMRRQKSFWRYIGILMAVILGLYVLAIVGAMVVGFFAAFAGHK